MWQEYRRKDKDQKYKNEHKWLLALWSSHVEFEGQGDAG